MRDEKNERGELHAYITNVFVYACMASGLGRTTCAWALTDDNENVDDDDDGDGDNDYNDNDDDGECITSEGMQIAI